MTWSTIKTPAIVLSSQPIREVDRSYRALTPEYGKVSFVGRGARKPKAKLSSHLEPFAVVDLEIVRGRRSVTVISVERRETFQHLFNTIEHRLLLLSIMGLIDRHTHADDPDPALYDELYHWMRFFNAAPALSPWRQRFFLSAFTLRFMDRLGYRVQLHACLSCQEQIVPLAFRWHTGKGGLVCTNCVQEHRHDWVDTRLIAEEVVTLLRLARESDPERLLASSLPLAHLRSVLEITHEFMYYHLPFASELPFWAGVIALDSQPSTV